MSWTTPGQGYNFNEPLSEGAKEVAKEYPRDREWQKLVKKHSRSIEKFQKGGASLDSKAEQDLVSWAMNNGEIRTSDYEETEEWIDDIILNNSYIPEGEPISEQILNLMEKPYDDKDVKNVQKLEKQFEKLLKEVDKTMRGSGLTAPAFSMVRSGITKGLEAIKKFYKVSGDVKDFQKSKQLRSEEIIFETKRQEVDAMKKVSKDMQSVLKDYQKISTMGDKTLKDTKYNPSYKKVLDARNAIITMIGTLNNQLKMNEEITNEGMLDFDKYKLLDDKIKKQIEDAKAEYDRTWDGVFVPMGKEGTSQRKEYNRRGDVFKAASAKYKALLKKHKVATFK